MTQNVQGASAEKLAASFTWTFRIGNGPEPVISGSQLHSARVAVSEGGLVMALVAEEDDPDRIFTRVFRPDLGWDSEIVELQTITNPVSNVRLFCTADNGAIASWSEGSGSTATLRSARFIDGQGWQAVETVATGVSLNFPVSMAVHPQGWGGVFYYTSTGGNFRYWVNGAWQAPEAMALVFQYLTLDAGPDGDMIAAFTGSPNVATGAVACYAARYAPGAGWTNTALASNNTYPLAVSASDADGEAVVMCRISQTVRSWKYENGGWTLLPDLTGTGIATQSPPNSLAMDPAGDGCLAWFGMDNGYMSVLAARFDAVSAWELPSPLDVGDWDPSVPSTACRPNGESWVLYSQSNGTTTSVWRSRWVPGTGWAAREELDGEALFSYDPKVASAGNQAAAVWLRENGDRQLMATILE